MIASIVVKLYNSCIMEQEFAVQLSNLEKKQLALEENKVILS